jgi:hypothetical protein
MRIEEAVEWQDDGYGGANISGYSKYHLVFDSLEEAMEVKKFLMSALIGNTEPEKSK